MRSALLLFLIAKAKRSGVWLFVLNVLMARIIPFNAPHKFRILEIDDEQIQTSAPYRKSNFNHIKGIHACAIATAAEFSAGFLLLTKLDPAKYRLIMGKLNAEYFYQAKKNSIACARLTNERLRKEVILPLEDNEAVTIEMKTVVRDISGNTVAEVMTTWQVKRWDRVRTKV
jgi:acyl-coenzyme A thioesterase PaaI-like protein